MTETRIERQRTAHLLALWEEATRILADSGFDHLGQPLERPERVTEWEDRGTEDYGTPAEWEHVWMAEHTGEGTDYVWTTVAERDPSTFELMQDGTYRKPSVGRLVDGKAGVLAVGRAAEDPSTVGPDGAPLGDYVLRHPDGTLDYVDAEPRRTRGRPRKPDHLLSAAARRKRNQRERDRVAAGEPTPQERAKMAAERR
ncbi:MAG: hypothetical protein LC687_01465, partial [Actinobacteria bacterium]|nr:hypothetical protein [Actinomycetota bacterium]